jgi:hypothetical protein
MLAGCFESPAHIAGPLDAAGLRGASRCLSVWNCLEMRVQSLGFLSGFAPPKSIPPGALGAVESPSSTADLRAPVLPNLSLDGGRAFHATRRA